MSDTALDICSRALLLIGANPITSFADGDTPSVVANKLYESTLRAQLTRRWGFTRTTVLLVRIAGTPVGQHWAAAYQLPIDDLLVIHRIEVNGLPIRYERFEDTIRCNASSCDCVFLTYSRRPDEAEFPPYFTDALELELAARFALPLTGQQELAGDYRRQAREAWALARNAGAQEQSARRLPMSRFMAARGQVRYSDVGAPGGCCCGDEDGEASTLPIVTSEPAFSVPEGTTAVATLTATGGAGSLSWSISGGVDAAKLTLSTGGVLAFANPPDYEAPTDIGGNNVYNIQVTVTDGITPTVQAIAITVTDVIEPAWNALDKNADIALSNSDLTATKTASGTGERVVRATTSKSTGKWVFEGTIDQCTDGLTWHLGIANAAQSLSQALGDSNNSVAYNKGGGGGAFTLNGVNIGGMNLASLGRKIMIAVDLDAKKIWAKIDTVTQWNLGFGTPDAGTGSYAFGTIAAGPYFPAASLYSQNDAATINLGATAFANAIPAGFTSWDGSRSG